MNYSTYMEPKKSYSPNFYQNETALMLPVFKMREIELGPILGESYVVINGLSEGEAVVTSGTFSVDAASQLGGKPSMMNPQGGKASAMPGMDMPGDNKLENELAMLEMDKSKYKK